MVQTTSRYARCFSNSNGSADTSIIGAGSNHPGGVNAAFLDGSVRFVKNRPQGQARRNGPRSTGTLGLDGSPDL